MIRVVVAEDSRAQRELLVSVLESDPAIRVVGEASNGAEAVELAVQLRPDLVTMDIHMPVMDGYEATREIMRQVPIPIIIVSSSVRPGDIAYSLEAIQAGALTAVAKPESPESPRFEEDRAQLVLMAKAMADVKVVRRWNSTPREEARPERPVSMAGEPRTVRLVAVAASTGGPAALQKILASLPASFPVPVVVVQHLARGFIGVLAEWLRSASKVRVKVADDGEHLLAGTVYFAPDDRHLGVTADGRAVLSDGGPVDGFRPSATHLFRSAAAAYREGVVAVILTGMGNDGVQGLREVRAAGARVLAQDEDSCVIFGMPGEAVRAGVVDQVLPLSAIGRRVVRMVNG